MTKTRAQVTLGMAVLAVLLICGWLWMSARSNAYDRRYSDCMNAREPALHAQNHYWPDDAYQQAMAECDRGAGPPPAPTGSPDSWKAP